ncbi:heptaprenyl diphosphate synthase component II [Virgibacillus phasianinus]|uniref:Heptaprenyl diphosphate synthase component 2 n=1 Tax=Virgibacillus phasianinus TaxID=2017483 RepID=A0A220U5A0_9BACI|nr:heptaprenyl diphosphate synthase component II [Virgibacillus phasianinus]ASK63338.1 heptaprenyl diphosphate synthase component II [Virgibacillus phasianinus]
MKLAKTYSYLKKDLDYIEKALDEVIQADHPVLRETSIQLLKAGGKRIRPVFVLLGGQFGDYNLERMKIVAITLELIHMASLVHDDVIDDAEIRRGEPTIRKQYDNRIAMYTGDYILARSLESITLINEKEAHQTLAKTIVEVCIGEIEQIKDKYEWDQTLRTYLRRIKRKTALLIATSCKLGAVVAGVNEKDTNRLFMYGYNIGMSYQIIDDILDFTSSEKVLGKPAGNDLLQGNVTLPVLYAMKDPAFFSLLKNTFANSESVSREQMQQLIQVLKQTDAIERSYQLSDMYLEKALRILDKLPDHRAKQSLHGIATYIGKRRS